VPNLAALIRVDRSELNSVGGNGGERPNGRQESPLCPSDLPLKKLGSRITR
jgi:hypothetical protein